MFPSLFEATKTYWRKLDELDVAYQEGKIPLQEVDTKVAELMAELAQERRTALATLMQWLTSRRDTILGLAMVVIAIYTWMLTTRLS
ncbi:hypothetical protein [Synechocystis sp. LKSZ1]|uniref:hypothetical protein n=1 Tax=Synechocystis sp. LKSZ1 TaxID=3144951 RepID=UPI00336BB8C3